MIKHKIIYMLYKAGPLKPSDIRKALEVFGYSRQSVNFAIRGLIDRDIVIKVEKKKNGIIKLSDSFRRKLDTEFSDFKDVNYSTFVERFILKKLEDTNKELDKINKKIILVDKNDIQG